MGLLGNPQPLMHARSGTQKSALFQGALRAGFLVLAMIVGAGLYAAMSDCGQHSSYGNGVTRPVDELQCDKRNGKLAPGCPPGAPDSTDSDTASVESAVQPEVASLVEAAPLEPELIPDQQASAQQESVLPEQGAFAQQEAALPEQQAIPQQEVPMRPEQEGQPGVQEQLPEAAPELAGPVGQVSDLVPMPAEAAEEQPAAQQEAQQEPERVEPQASFEEGPLPETIEERGPDMLTDPYGVNPVMSTGEVALLTKYMRNAGEYFEWGAGGSTHLAERLKAQCITTVDSSNTWIARIKEGMSLPCLHMQWVNLGPVDEWGVPTTESYRQMWPTYSSYIGLVDRPITSVLVDGRFRVACALHAFLSIGPDATVMIHDYASRPGYHVVEQWFDIIEAQDEMIVLRPNAEKQADEEWRARARAQIAISQYETA